MEQPTHHYSPQLNPPTSAPERLLTAARDRLDAFPPWVLLIQAFIGLGWLRAAVEKAIDSSWWSGEYLGDFLVAQQDLALAWYEPFLNFIVAPNAVAISFIVMIAQFAIGGALLAGRRQGLALGAGMFLNLMFIAAGAVTPSVFYLLAQGAVALWLAERSRRRDLTKLYDMALLGGATLTGLSLPLTETIDPAEVIHDPAIMLATAGGFTAGLALDLRRRHVTGKQPDVAVEPERAIVGSR